MAEMIGFVDDQKLVVPISGAISMQRGFMRAEFIGLDILIPKDINPQAIRAGWLVWRHLYDVEKGYRVGLGSSRIMTWTEGTANLSLEVLRHDSAPDAGPRKRTLMETSTLRPFAEGNLVISEDAQARWILGADNNRTSLEVTLIWTCPLTDSIGMVPQDNTDKRVNRFMLAARQPYGTLMVDPAESSVEVLNDRAVALVSGLVSRVKCLGV